MGRNRHGPKLLWAEMSSDLLHPYCATMLSGVNSSLKAEILMHSLVNLGGGKGYAYLFQEIGNREGLICLPSATLSQDNVLDLYAVL